MCVCVVSCVVFLRNKKIIKRIKKIICLILPRSTAKVGGTTHLHEPLIKYKFVNVCDRLMCSLSVLLLLFFFFFPFFSI